MSIATVISGGFGSFGSPSSVIMRGYSSGEVVVVPCYRLTLSFDPDYAQTLSFDPDYSLTLSMRCA